MCLTANTPQPFIAVSDTIIVKRKINFLDVLFYLWNGIRNPKCKGQIIHDFL